MTTHKSHRAPKKTTAVIAIILILPALYIFGVWLSVFSGDLTPVQQIKLFEGKFPSAIASYKMLLGFSMVCCLLAIIFASRSFKQRLLSLRIAMWLTVMLACLIFFVDVFQML